MNLLNFKYSFLGLAASSLVLVSCNGGSSDSGEGEDFVDSAEVVEETVSGTAEPQYYQIPSPNDLFSLIKSNDLDYNADLISTDPPSYAGSKAQALNFGRLTADIAYTSSFAKHQESITNFDNLRKLGQDLGIDYVFSEMMVGRVKNNMDNSDSLSVITTDSYYNIISMLEQNAKKSTLALIAAGGFVESLYLVLNLAGDYSENNKMVQSIADQKFAFENLLDYLSSFENQDEIGSVVSDLNDIRDTFEELSEEGDQASAMSKNDEGKMVLGGSKVTISAAQFDALKTKVTELRGRYAAGNI